MNRRAFIGTFAGGLLAVPLAAEAQPAGKVPRVAYLRVSSAAGATWGVEAFRQGLRELGYIEGRNILIEYRWVDGRFDRLPALAADLARVAVDVIVASNTPAALAARNATGTIPIVLVTSGDPVGSGLVASLARPLRERHGAEPVFDSGDERKAAGATQTGIPDSQPCGGARQSRESADGWPLDGDRTRGSTARPAASRRAGTRAERIR